MLSDVSLSPIEVVRSSVEFSDQSSDDEATLSSFLAAEEIKEDEPPETAVLGYRASDYEVEDFYAGVHLHYCVRKEDPWSEGVVVRASVFFFPVTQKVTRDTQVFLLCHGCHG